MFGFFLCLLCLRNAFGDRSKIFHEGDHLLPGFNIEALEVAKEYRRQSPECPEVMEKVTVYR